MVLCEEQFRKTVTGLDMRIKVKADKNTLKNADSDS